MALVSDESDKIRRVSITELNTGEVMVRANEALVLNELRNVLRRAAERDLVIEDMRAAIDHLQVGQIAAEAQIQQLRHAYEVLARQKAELYQRQDLLASMCDTLTRKLEEQTERHEKLAEDVSDRD